MPAQSTQTHDRQTHTHIPCLTLYCAGGRVFRSMTVCVCVCVYACVCVRVRACVFACPPTCASKDCRRCATTAGSAPFVFASAVAGGPGMVGAIGIPLVGGLAVCCPPAVSPPLLANTPLVFILIPAPVPALSPNAAAVLKPLVCALVMLLTMLPVLVCCSRADWTCCLRNSSSAAIWFLKSRMAAMSLSSSLLTRMAWQM